jgi:hypothetical protein
MAPKQTKKNEVVTTQAVNDQKALTQPGGPGEVALTMFAEDAGSGFENVSAQDMAVPFISILQALSPQLRGNTRIENAHEGQLFNTVTNELYDDAVVIPCAFNKVWVEWVDRDKGGGFVAQHQTDEIMAHTVRNEKGLDVLPNGNVVSQTAYHYCLLVKPDGSLQRVVISMVRTQLKKSRRWVSRMLDVKLPIGPGGAMVSAPMFSQTYKLETEMETNKVNQTYFGYKIGNPNKVLNEYTYLEARKFANEVKKGLVKVVPPEELVNETAPVTESEHF